MKYIVLCVLLLCGLTTASFAQERGTWMSYVNWNMGSTINNHFAKQFSAAGADFGYAIFAAKDLAIGAGLGWHNYAQYAPRQTYYFEHGAATTDMYKYIFTLPLTVTATKYFHAGSLFHPYVKVGAGVLYSEQNLYYNVYETDSHSWGFTVIPEAGVNVKVSRTARWSFNAGIRYLYATNKAGQYSIGSIQAYDLSAGINWLWR
jgi:hypothetical protein